MALLPFQRKSYSGFLRSEKNPSPPAGIKPRIQQSSFSNLFITSPTSRLILKSFLHFTYVTVHSPTFSSLHLRHSPFSNTFVASPTSQLILQPFFRFSYVTGSSPTRWRTVRCTAYPIPVLTSADDLCRRCYSSQTNIKMANCKNIRNLWNACISSQFWISMFIYLRE